MDFQSTPEPKPPPTPESEPTPTPEYNPPPTPEHKPPPTPCIAPAQILTPGADEACLVQRRRGGFVRAAQASLQNNLHDGVGFLELANMGDFAANVFNEIPVPIYAIPLMAIGGTVALILPYIAMVDGRRSWRNYQLLRSENRTIRGISKGTEEKSQAIAHDARIYLDMNFKETGVELVDRIIMDALMGGGAILVGVGTFMAIGGAHPTVYFISNLFSGYLGNSFAALYGLMNTAWAMFVWIRAHRHHTLGRRKLNAETVGSLLERRILAVQLHAVVHGVTCLTAGWASLVTATRWWGYVVLIPCVFASAWCNFYFKRNIGYDRPMLSSIPEIDEDAIIKELEVVHQRKMEIKKKPLLEFLHAKGEGIDSIKLALQFIVRYNFFADFALALTKDTTLFKALYGDPGREQVVVRSDEILAADPCHEPRLLEIARECINISGPVQLEYRERYLLELLGNSVHYETLPPVTRGRRLSLRRSMRGSISGRA